MSAAGRGVVRVEREVRVTRDRKVVDGECVEHLGCLDLGWHCPSTADLRKAVRDEEDKDNQSTVGRAFDLEIPKQ